MSLKDALAKAKTEEDVKDAYIKALGLKRYHKGLVDIQSEEIWFEAKGGVSSPVVMFAQLLFYLRDARRKGEHIPAFLAVIDREKAAILPTEHALPLLADKNIVWPDSGSKAGRALTAQGNALAAQVAPHIETHFVVYDIATHEAEFKAAVKAAIKEGRIIRTPITPDNLRQVFDRWVSMIGNELSGVKETDYAVLFFADIMHDGKKAAVRDLPAKLLHDDEKPIFLLNGITYELASLHGYRSFWAIYHRPPEEAYRRYLLERRDSLLPLDERAYKGAYFTPLNIVDRAYDLLGEALGKNWQQNYLVWDMCCGVGNLEVKHSNYRNIFMSTLDDADIKVMRASQTCLGASIFQYDYLNDDVSDGGKIDYSLTDKVPLQLRQAILDAQAKSKGAKKILVLINPPYAEVTSSGIKTANRNERGNKAGVTATMVGKKMISSYGKASNELFMQFIARIHQEIPGAVLAIFSKLKYISAPTLEDFRRLWKAKFLAGFAMRSQVFDGLIGDFPIGFLIWDTDIHTEVGDVEVSVIDKAGRNIGKKVFYNYDGKNLLTDWVKRPPSNTTPALPLKNAVTPATAYKDLRGTRWSDNAVAWLNCAGNDLQNAGAKTMLLSSGYSSARGFFVNSDNVGDAAVVFAARRLIRPTWLNDRDQFLQPSRDLPEIFRTDCLVWMLFNGSNLTAGADELEWGGRTWSLVNHFVPYTELEVGAPKRFESDFMSSHLSKLKKSSEAEAVLEEGRRLWSLYHRSSFGRSIREVYRLNRPDAGWYQIRNALLVNSKNQMVSFVNFQSAYIALTEKLRPLVYEFGFLPGEQRLN
jgi:hypothetical protein